jgi:hypothetical protein
MLSKPLPTSLPPSFPGQFVPPSHLATVSRLNHELEAALERVLALETRATAAFGPKRPQGKNGAAESQVCAVM